VSDSNVDFVEELTHLINKHGVDASCDTPDFIIAFHVVGLINHLRIAEQLKKQWNGEETDVKNTAP